MKNIPCLQEVVRPGRPKWVPLITPYPSGLLASMVAPLPCPVDAHELLTNEEQELAATMTIRRRSRWIAGRICLSAALQDMGIFRGSATMNQSSLLIASNGAPNLPAGTVGSVSHKGPVIVGLVDSDRGYRVGIDLEFVEHNEEQIATRILTQEELDRVKRLRPDLRNRVIAMCFSLKESTYKALTASQQIGVDFSDISVVDWLSEEDNTIQEVSIRLHAASAVKRACGTIETAENWILSTARIKKEELD